MKKTYFFIMLLLLMFFSTNAIVNDSFTVNAAEEIITKEIVTYTENVYDENNELIEDNNVSRDEYNRKIKSEKARLSIERAINKIGNAKAGRNLEKLLYDNSNDYTISPLYIPEDPIVRSKIIGPYTRYLDMLCSSGDLTYCEGNAITTSSYTTHTLMVSVNPNGRTGKVKSKLVWDIIPYNLFTDKMAISFDGDLITYPDSSFKATHTTEYEYDGVSPVVRTYGINSMERPTHGIIFNVVLDEHNPRNPMEKITLTMEFNFILKEGDSFIDKEINALKFGAMYAHQYPYIKIGFGGSLGATISGPSEGFILTASMTRKYDGDRYISVMMDINN